MMSAPAPLRHPLTNGLLVCALLLLTSWASGNAQLRSLPQSFHDWRRSEGLRHATVSLEVVRLPRTAPQQPSTVGHPAIERGQVLYGYDAERLMIPASVLKLMTAATGFRLLGADYVWPDSVPLVDTAAVALAGLEHYNPDWLIEDIDPDYMPPLENLLPDSGKVLSEVMRETLLESLNLEAETMLHLLTPSCRLDSGLLTMQRYWTERGLDTECLRLYDGCGLAPSDRLTAHAACSVLAEMQFDDDFRHAMAVAGREGTVRNFLKGTRLAGKARLKTGTLKTAVNYAGYCLGSDGRTHAVCIFVNNHTCRPQEVRRGIEKLLLSLIP